MDPSINTRVLGEPMILSGIFAGVTALIGYKLGKSMGSVWALAFSLCSLFLGLFSLIVGISMVHIG